MPNIQYGTNFNAETTYVPGLYEQVVPPAPSPGGQPTTVSFVVGTRSWGALNSPQLMSSPQQSQATYGGIGPSAITDVHDLATDVQIALGQGSQTAGLALYAVGAADGSQTAATSNLKDTAGANVLPLSGRYTGVLGNQISAITSAGGPGPDATITLTGSTTTNDTINIKIVNNALTGGVANVFYTLVSGDSSLTLLATHLSAQINANAVLTAQQFTATSLGAVVTISWPQALQTVNITTAINGSTTATVGGTVTTSDSVGIKVIDAGLSGGSLTISYTTVGGDSTTNIATGLKNAINASAPLTAIGVTALSSAAVVTVKSTSQNQTTYASVLSAGATETVTFAAGASEIATNARINSVQLVIVPFPGGGTNETYAGLSGLPSRFPGAAQLALNNGLNSARPQSQLVTAGTPAPTTLGPVLTQVTLSGGTDGRSVTTSNLLGNAGDAPPTGIYTAQRLQFTPSGLWIAGLTDLTAAPTMQAFCDLSDIAYGLTFPTGMSTADAVSAKYESGISDYNGFFFKDWQWFKDTANNINRLVPPLPFAMGTITALAPWDSPLGVAISLSLGTERDNPFTGSQPYTYAELNSLGQAGIMLLERQNPGAVVFQNGFNSVGNNDPTAYVEYTRLTNYIISTNAATLNQFLGKLTGFTSTDSVRAQMTSVLNQFFQNMKSKNQIAGFNVNISASNNPNTQLAAHEVQVNETITYLPSIQVIFTQTQGGTTVVTANQGS